ncbi:hypothetical protein [Mycobacterium sp.]|jgi:hypothetical protein
MITTNAFGVRTAGNAGSHHAAHAAAAALAASHKHIAAATDASVNRGST